MDEVYKWIKGERSEEEALRAAAAIKRTRIVDLTEELALTAADLSPAHGLAMPDSMMLAAARIHDAELLTTDAAFQGTEGADRLLEEEVEERRPERHRSSRIVTGSGHPPLRATLQTSPARTS